MRIILFVLIFNCPGLLAAQSITGRWRGEFIIQDSIKVPFNFEIDKASNVILINAEERDTAGKATIVKDSLFIPLDQFDNLLAFKITGSNMTGVLRKQDGTQDLAFLSAEKNKLYRFKNTGVKPARNYTGKYEVVFNYGDKQEVCVGIFKQKGNKLTATFLKPSGDTRYQEGIISGNKFYLSSFIGSTPGYYYGQFDNEYEFTGEQVGTRTKYSIKGKLNAEAKLPDESPAMAAGDTFYFVLPDMDGTMISLNDEQFKNKAVIIAITGTWCPNCIDEARFLSPWYDKNKSRGVEIIAVHFERQADTAHARKVMSRYQQRFNVNYTQVFGGTTAKEDIQKSLPDIKGFKAFPTTIYLDRAHKIVKVHSGFSGPATGKYYEEFIEEFNTLMDELLNL